MLSEGSRWPKSCKCSRRSRSWHGGALVWAFETGPEEIGSKTSHWAKWFGYPDLPGYILTKSTDAYVLAGGIFLAVLYVLLVWVWPWWRKNYPRLVPFQEAALIGFEQAEHLGLEELISEVHQSLNDKLEWFRYAFLVDENIRLYGRKLPSRRLRQISLQDRRHLKPHNTRNELRSEFASNPTVYTDVAVTRGGIRRYIRKLRRLSRAKL